MNHKIIIGAPMRECAKCIAQGTPCAYHAELEEKKNDRDYKERLKAKPTILDQLRTDLEIYQEGVAESPNAQVRDHYTKLCKETYQKIQELEHPPQNWRPVVGSLLKKLQVYGFTLVSVDNGGETHHLTGTNREQRQQAKAAICAVDESNLYVDTPEGARKWLYIVLGNEPEETVADYSGSGLDEVIEEFSKQWEGVKCPTT